MARPTRAATTLIAAALLAAGTVLAPGAGAPAQAAAGYDEITAAVAPHTATMTIALVAPPGTTPNFSRDDAARAADQAAEFLERETDGALQVEIDRVVDWQFPEETWPCSWSGAWLDWVSPRIGWERGPGKHLTVMVPHGEPCPGWANGEQGWALDAGGRTYQPGPDSSTLAHEWGHNFSQAHAFSTACPTWDFVATDGRTPAECEKKEYGNRMDNMGGSWTMTPSSSPSLARIGMLPRHLQPRCEGAATVAARSVAEGASERDAISWESATEPGVRYWVDYRDGQQAAKYADLHVSSWGFWPGRSGVQILRTDPEVPFGATVLERPGDPSDHAQLLEDGEVVTLADGTTVSWRAIDGRSDRADITVDRAC